MSSVEYSQSQIEQGSEHFSEESSAVDVHNMGVKISEEQARRQLVRFEHDLKDLYANYDKIDADWLKKATNKLGMFQRLDLDKKEHSRLPKDV